MKSSERSSKRVFDKACLRTVFFLASGARAFVPSPLAAAGMDQPALARSEISDTAFMGAWLSLRREVVLDGGESPELSLRRDHFALGSVVQGEGWDASVELGGQRGTAEVGLEGMAMRWTPAWEDRSTVRMRRGEGFQVGLDLHHEDGTVSVRAMGFIPVAAASVGFTGMRDQGRGTVGLVRGSSEPIPLAWRSSGWEAGGSLSAPVQVWGSVRAQIGWGEAHPLPTDGRYRLETRTTSSGWSLAWDPKDEGPWLSLASRHSIFRSSGWSDTLGSDQLFHTARLESSFRKGAVGWRGGGWSAGLHGEEAGFFAPQSSFFTPFLSWNALDASTWSPIDQILSDQREHVSASVEYRSWGAEIAWRREGRAIDLSLVADATWRSLEAHVLHRTSRMDLLGTRWSVVTDSVGAPRMRAVILGLGPGGTLHLGRFGDLGVDGNVAIPLWFERLRRDGAVDAPSGTAKDDGDGLAGLWSLGASWRGTW